MDLGERRVLILYGSQTGTAQDVAEKLARESKRRHFNVTVSSLDSYDIVSMYNRYVMLYVEFRLLCSLFLV